MIPAAFSALADHLWQSTIFAVAAAMLTLVLRKNRAQLRYCIWLAASVKFLLPFSLLVSAGSLFQWRSASPVQIPAASLVEQITQPFTIPLTTVAPAPASAIPATPLWTGALAVVWLVGFTFVLLRWWRRWRQVHTAAKAASPLQMASPVPVMSTPTQLEPGVFGVFRPVLLLPDGIVERLTPAQLQSILAHEFCHISRRDNLAAALHMFVEAVFWFHPLVWRIGSKLIDERERACDEEVLRLGNEPFAYASGILNVCRHYAESPLACASGVTGSELKGRIETIMLDTISRKLTITRKLLLGAAAMTAISGPILIGVLNPMRSRAQSKPETLTFEVASIKPGDPDARGVRFQILPGGGFKADNVRLRQLVEFAYEVNPNQISGGPNWLNSAGYDVLAKAPQSEGAEDVRQLSEAQRKVLEEQMRARLRALLAERFSLTVRRETKEMPIYELVVAKNGPKLKASDTGGNNNQTQMRGRPGDLNAANGTIAMLATHLARSLGRPVVDRTGLTGRYDYTLTWTPDSPAGPGRQGPDGPGGGPGEKAGAIGAPTADPSGPSLFAAIQEQLGLKLESAKGPVDTIVIDRAEKPTEN